MRQRFKAARLDPALRLLMDRVPGRQIIGDHSPPTAGPDHIAHGVEDHPRGVFALRRLFFHQRQVRRAKRPFLIADIALVTGLMGGCFLWHPKRDAQMYLHSTALSSRKCVTGSRAWRLVVISSAE